MYRLTCSLVTINPWRMLRELAQVTLLWHDGGAAGWCRHSTSEVSLRRGLNQRERRSTICHEIVHLTRGPAYVGHEDWEERAVEAEASRILIPLADLSRALQWTSDVDELAHELWVDRGTVETRLARLHPAERHHLRRVVAAREESC
jgi:hypothetical protein